MKRLLVIVTLALLAVAAAGHVPRTGPDRAVRHVQDPSVSQAFYAELNGSETHTYTFDVEQGDRVLAQVLVPPHRSRAPTARVAGAVNATLDAAPGRPVYEAFGPGAHRVAGGVDVNASRGGEVTVTVDGTGRYALVVGFEEAFTPAEWAATPILVLGVYVWGGAPWWTVVLPLLAAVLGGAWVWHRREPHPTVHVWLVRGGALLCVASATVIAVQMAWALSWTGWTAGAAVTLGIIALQAGAGAAGVRLEEMHGRRGRALLGAAGVFGVAVWAGYLAGPVFYLLAALIPPHLGDTVGRWIGE